MISISRVCKCHTYVITNIDKAELVYIDLQTCTNLQFPSGECLLHLAIQMSMVCTYTAKTFINVDNNKRFYYRNRK